IECKQFGIHTAIETCGFAPWRSLKEISEYTDLFLYDLKALDDKIHQEYTGVSNEIILDNIRKLSKHGCQIIIRVPLIPGVNDHPESLVELGEFVSSLPHVYQLDLLPYHNSGIEKYKRLNRSYHLSDIQRASQEHLDSLAEYLSAYGINVNAGE
ncbi:MAG: radical SAM protein, partial [Anaerolineaceae bacterium]|nr:radical SAM protein [Anaerolineaceae bacterium]